MLLSVAFRALMNPLLRVLCTHVHVNFKVAADGRWCP